MKISLLLSNRKQQILKKWSDLILKTYPADTARFLGEQKNRFSNPVGHTISEGTEKIFDGLVEGKNAETISGLLDDIIRIRAIQNFTPSQAVGFVFLLKKAIREELMKEIRTHQMFDKLLALESDIDDLTGISFDIYMKYREKINTLRTNELKSRISWMEKHSNIFREIDVEKEDTAGL